MYKPSGLWQAFVQMLQLLRYAASNVCTHDGKARRCKCHLPRRNRTARRLP